MANVVKYSALASKTRAMYGKLLAQSDYHELMRKRSVAEIAAYLKTQTHFSGILQNVDENDIHRGQLETILKKELLSDYDKLIAFTNGNVRTFIKILYKRHEIESLKLLFRTFASKTAKKEAISDSLMFLSRCDKINIPKLALSRNPSEFLLALQETEYYDVIRPFVNDENRFMLFNIEMSLDSYFYDTIHRSMRNCFDSDDEKIVEKLIGTEIDSFNMLTIYRGKVFFKMDRDVINSYLIPYSGTLTKQDTQAMLDAPDKDELLKIISHTHYKTVFHGTDERWFELQFQNYLVGVNRRFFTKNSFSIACVLSYLKLKETELNNIITLIEGIRYRLSEDVLKQYVSGLTEF